MLVGLGLEPRRGHETDVNVDSLGLKFVDMLPPTGPKGVIFFF